MYIFSEFTGYRHGWNLTSSPLPVTDDSQSRLTIFMANRVPADI